MKKKINTKKHKLQAIPCIALALLGVGIGVLLYPTASDLVYRHEADETITLFEDVCRELKTPTEQTPENPTKLMPANELLDYLKSENERIFANGQADLVDAFSYSQPAVKLEDFGISNGMLAYLEIPAMELELPLYLGASDENLDKGAAHLTGTSYPIGGVNTNAVIAAHRGAYTSRMFREIDKLVVGDDVIIHNFYETLNYRVASVKIIEPTDIGAIKIQSGLDMVTLVTCHPRGKNTYRYVVYCERY